MDAIINCVVKITTAVIVLYLYIFLVCYIYPWFTMKLVWRGERYAPRGRRRVVFDGGRGVVYSPDVKIRKYIPQYAIYLIDGSKYVRCKLNPHIEHMRYDVISLDINNKLLDVVSVNEKISSRGNTQPVKLPTDTAYACVVPRRVDGKSIRGEKTITYSKKGCVWFGILTTVTTVVMSWFLHDGLSALFHVLYGKFEDTSIFEVLLRAFLYGAAISIFGLLVYHRRCTKVINK